MKRFIAALVALSFLILPASAWDNRRMDVHTKEAIFSLAGICSATVIDKEDRMLLTAAHCTTPFEHNKKVEASHYEDPKYELVYEDTYVSHKYVDPNTGTEVYAKYKVEIVLVDKDHDYAILKIKDDSVILPIEAELSTAPVYRGDTVYTIGNPRGLEATLSKGIISNNYRDISDISPWKFPMYQIDAPGVAPGSSGCAVYNEDEEIIGVLVAGIQPGLTFIVPIKYIQEGLAKIHGSV